MHVMAVARKLAAMGLLLLVVVVALPGAGRAEDRMELHLVLAFDVSASVNDEEFDLQRTGTARAFRDPAVASAVAHAPGGIAVAIVQWSSVTRQALGLDWVRLRSPSGTAAYADTVADMPRRLPGGGTMIHSGLEFAARMLETAPGTARRQVIDLSGNGEADDLDLLHEMRDRLVRRGVVINALAIEELKYRDLTSYFHAHVIGGNGAFVITAEDFEDVASAMRIKLLREIAGPRFSGSAPVGARMSGPLDDPDQEQQDHRADCSVYDGPDEAPSYAEAQPWQYEARDEGSDNAEGHVSQKPEPDALDDQAGKPASHGADNQHDQNALDTHRRPLH